MHVHVSCVEGGVTRRVVCLWPGIHSVVTRVVVMVVVVVEVGVVVVVVVVVVVEVMP
jgi:hypothetical protein